MELNQLEALKQRVRQILESGLAIAVLGWKASNHDDFTRILPSRKVLFYEEAPSSLGGTIGLALCTKFVSHTSVNRIKAGKTPVHGAILGNGVIKEIFRSCEDLFIVVPKHVVAPAPVLVLMSPTKVLPTVQPVETKMEMTDAERLAKFAEAFRVEVNKEGLVSRFRLPRLLSELGLEKTVKQIVADGWVETHKEEGKTKIGWYKAGPKLASSDSKPKVEPTDPQEKLVYLLGLEIPTRTEIADLEQKLATAKALMGRINKARGVMEEAKKI